MAVIKDVANMAGLSVSVVSKYLKNPDSVRADTKANIEKAIDALDYVPSTQARALRTGKTGMISIISPNITNPFFAELFSAIQAHALKCGYSALLQTIPTLEAAEESVVSHPFAVSSISRVDGIIICFPDEEKIVSLLRQQWKRLPIALLSWNVQTDADVNIVVDVEKGIYTVTKHLLLKGHRVIGYVGAPEKSTTSQEKQKGFLRAMKEAQILIYPELICHGPYDSQTGYQAAKKFWHSGLMPTAIITEADIFAVGCIKYCHKKHIAVPLEMAVTGFDDIPMAEMYHPPITTVRLPIQEMGVQAVNTLCALINQSPLQSCAEFHYEPELIVRRSTNLDYIEKI